MSNLCAVCGTGVSDDWFAVIGDDGQFTSMVCCQCEIDWALRMLPMRVVKLPDDKPDTIYRLIHEGVWWE